MSVHDPAQCPSECHLTLPQGFELPLGWQTWPGQRWLFLSPPLGGGTSFQLGRPHGPLQGLLAAGRVTLNRLRPQQPGRRRLRRSLLLLLLLLSVCSSRRPRAGRAAGRAWLPAWVSSLCSGRSGAGHWTPHCGHTSCASASSVMKQRLWSVGGLVAQGAGPRRRARANAIRVCAQRLCRHPQTRTRVVKDTDGGGAGEKRRNVRRVSLSEGGSHSRRGLGCHTFSLRDGLSK